MWLRVVLFGVPTAVAVVLVRKIGTPEDPTGYLTRWLTGSVWAYCSIEMLAAGLVGCAGIVGLELPPLHNNPLRSRSLAEFWARRWNLPVHAMLFEHCFRPVAPRVKPTSALLITFVASAALHFWIIFAACGPVLAASMATFFLAHASLFLVERHVRVRHWHRALQHIWTAVTVLVTLPLLLEPLMRVALG